VILGDACIEVSPALVVFPQEQANSNSAIPVQVFSMVLRFKLTASIKRRDRKRYSVDNLRGGERAPV
jgi:hypothetical protein